MNNKLSRYYATTLTFVVFILNLNYLQSNLIFGSYFLFVDYIGLYYILRTY
jgi:hypothetical protein